MALPPASWEGDSVVSMPAPTGARFKSMGDPPRGIFSHYRKRGYTGGREAGDPRPESMPDPAKPALEETLQQLGAKRIEATLVARLALDGALGTREIVERTGLRPPHGSVGTAGLPGPP